MRFFKRIENSLSANELIGRQIEINTREKKLSIDKNHWFVFDKIQALLTLLLSVGSVIIGIVSYENTANIAALSKIVSSDSGINVKTSNVLIDLDSQISSLHRITGRLDTSVNLLKGQQSIQNSLLDFTLKSPVQKAAYFYNKEVQDSKGILKIKDFFDHEMATYAYDRDSGRLLKLIDTVITKFYSISSDNYFFLSNQFLTYSWSESIGSLQSLKDYIQTEYGDFSKPMNPNDSRTMRAKSTTDYVEEVFSDISLKLEHTKNYIDARLELDKKFNNDDLNIWHP